MPSEESMKAKDSGAFIVPESRRAAVLEGLKQAERSELVSDGDMEKLWKKFGL